MNIDFSDLDNYSAATRIPFTACTFTMRYPHTQRVLKSISACLPGDAAPHAARWSWAVRPGISVDFGEDRLSSSHWVSRQHAPLCALLRATPGASAAVGVSLFRRDGSASLLLFCLSFIFLHAFTLRAARTLPLTLFFLRADMGIAAQWRVALVLAASGAAAAWRNSHRASDARAPGCGIARLGIYYVPASAVCRRTLLHTLRQAGTW